MIPFPSLAFAKKSEPDVCARKASILSNGDPRSAPGSGLSQCSSLRSRELATILRVLTKMRLTYQRLELVNRSVDISIINSKNRATGGSSKHIPCMSTHVHERDVKLTTQTLWGGNGESRRVTNSWCDEQWVKTTLPSASKAITVSRPTIFRNRFSEIILAGFSVELYTCP